MLRRGATEGGQESLVEYLERVVVPRAERNAAGEKQAGRRRLWRLRATWLAAATGLVLTACALGGWSLAQSQRANPAQPAPACVSSSRSEVEQRLANGQLGAVCIDENPAPALMSTGDAPMHQPGEAQGFPMYG